MKKIIWLTDTHVTFSFLWKKYALVRHIKNLEADAVFLTGDISNGLFIDYVLYYLATHIDIPIYFVLGNHDYYFKSFNDVHNDIRSLSKRYDNLFWLTENHPLKLKNDTCVIGTEGWYDSQLGDSEYMKFTIDWWLIEDFRKLKNMSERIESFRSIAKNSASNIENKLIQAFNEGYKEVYLLTHVPPFKEATRDEGTIMENFWLPYNTNSAMGRTIKNVMSNFPDKKLNILAGHTHTRVVVNLDHNIECRVNNANYFNVGFNNKEIILI